MGLESVPVLRDGQQRGVRARKQDVVAGGSENRLQPLDEARGVLTRIGSQATVLGGPGPEPRGRPRGADSGDLEPGPAETSQRC